MAKGTVFIPRDGYEGIDAGSLCMRTAVKVDRNGCEYDELLVLGTRTRVWVPESRLLSDFDAVEAEYFPEIGMMGVPKGE
jgi:hypothetical protein